MHTSLGIRGHSIEQNNHEPCPVCSYNLMGEVGFNWVIEQALSYNFELGYTLWERNNHKGDWFSLGWAIDSQTSNLCIDRESKARRTRMKEQVREGGQSAKSQTCVKARLTKTWGMLNGWMFVTGRERQESHLGRRRSQSAQAVEGLKGTLSGFVTKQHRLSNLCHAA